ncbi:MAG: acyl-CoA dehydrogenase family protein [Deltaproteobacteria bacterium]|nr:acyl-CoA dehydrogenase family protein [Deltaproteobacteria bacterium]
MIDFQLTDEQSLIQETARRILAKACPREEVRRLDGADEFPAAAVRALGEAGLLGLTIEARYGGGGVDTLGALLVIEEAARTSGALGFAATLFLSYGGQILGKLGSERQRERLLPRIARGECLVALALTEPGAGSDLASIRTRAARDGDALVVRGEKTFITSADAADRLVVLVRTDPQAPRSGAFSFVVVDAKQPGVSIRRIEKLGYKGSSLCSIHFDDVRVGAEDVLGGASSTGAGWRQLTAILDVEHLELAANSLGIATAAFDEALAYAKQREQFGRKVGEFQSIAHLLAEIDADIHAARLVLRHAAWLYDAGRPCGREGAIAKLAASEAAKRAALACLQIHGGSGYTMELDVQRYVRDALLLTIGGGTSQIQKNVIARHLGLRIG